MSSSLRSFQKRHSDSGTAGMRASIYNQISSWLRDAKWADEDKADRLLQKMQYGPDKFISPNPEADYQEEAKRIFYELKEEYGLKTETEARREKRTYEDAETQRARETIFDNFDEIQDGDPRGLIPAITDAYGEDFVESTIQEARRHYDAEATETAETPVDADKTESTEITETAPGREASSPEPRKAARRLARLPRPVRGIAVGAYVLARYNPYE